MSQRILSALAVLGIILSFNSHLHAQAAPAAGNSPEWVTIHNDFLWYDNNGDRIYTRSGDLRQFNGTYYWYGGNQRGGFRAQYCYSSTDLVHWTSHGVVLSHNTDSNRIDVVYNEATKKYVMIMKYDGNGAHFGISTADKPEGPFEFQSQVLVDDALMGDSSVFIDDDGKAYLCYVSWAVGTNAQHGLYHLSDDFTKLDKRIYLWDIRSREAPHIMKRNGIYYYGTSLTAWIDSSGTNYYTATDLAGPWSDAKPLTTPGSNNSWDTQVDLVYPFKGTEGTLYMYVGDRWIQDAGAGRNGDYIWLPFEWDGDTPILNYYQDWEMNVKAGTWRKFDPARNLAMGKTATASSEQGDNAAARATDPSTYQDYINSYWESGAADEQWLMVDLGSPMDVNRVILKWNNNAAKDFKIQTSTDSTNWTDVFTTDKGASNSVTDETFATTSARYVRMYATAKAPVVAGRGRGRGGFGRGGARRGGRGGAGRGGAAQGDAAAAVAPASQPTPGAYSLFDFMVLKD